MPRAARLALALALASVLSAAADEAPAPPARPRRTAQAAEPVSLDWLFKLFPYLRGEHDQLALAPGAPLALLVPLRAPHGNEEHEGAVEYSGHVGSQPARPPAVRSRVSAQATTDDAAVHAHNQPDPAFISQVPSSELVALYRAQRPRDPRPPPVVVEDRRPYGLRANSPFGWLPTPGRSQANTTSNDTRQLSPVPVNLASGPALTSPTTPTFSRSLELRGRLVVPRPGYTEYYNASWYAPTGSMRVDFYGGATSVFRSVEPARIFRLERRLDRAGDAPRVRCAVMTQDPATATPADYMPPGLPDPRPFKFIERAEHTSGARVEVWRHKVAGAPGELGAARGEALTYSHELLLTRTAEGEAIPVEYSVTIESSVLGTFDQYVHAFDEVRALEPSEELLHANTSECDVIESTAGLARVDPLREFTQLTRDPRHDDMLASFMKNYKRQYVDDTETAVRKSLLLQSLRFAEAGNRVGATFAMGATPLADRLDAELRAMAGVAEQPQRVPSEPFPYSRSETRDHSDGLPDQFDWRQMGGVTHVRSQGQCASCWAFAVAGAVEGALFRQTRKLVPLSEQALVDCAHPYGGGGCKPTWPTAAYDYVVERGLPPLDAYRDYEAKVGECQDTKVPPATYISAHVNVTRYSYSALKVAIARHAPTVVIIDMAPASFKTYTSGVYYDGRCNKGSQKIKHAVLAVGWGGDRRSGGFLVLKNSHSSRWGEGGFMRLAARANVCGALERPSYPRLERGDVPAAGAGGRGARL